MLWRRFATCATGTCSAATADARTTAGVTPTCWCLVSTAPWTPAASAVRRMEPRFCGSCTLSNSTNRGCVDALCCLHHRIKARVLKRFGRCGNALMVGAAHHTVQRQPLDTYDRDMLLGHQRLQVPQVLRCVVDAIGKVDLFYLARPQSLQHRPASIDVCLNPFNLADHTRPWPCTLISERAPLKEGPASCRWNGRPRPESARVPGGSCRLCAWRSLKGAQSPLNPRGERAA